MKKTITLLMAYLCLSVSHAQAQNAPITEQVTLHVATAGTLQDMIDPSIRPLITNLKLTGKLNGDDLLIIREMAGADRYGNPTQGYALETLDISEATIVPFGDSYVTVYRVVTLGNVSTTYEYIYETNRYERYSTDGLSYVWGDNYGLDYLFYQCKNIKKVKLPEYFGDGYSKERTPWANGTFIGCTSLTSVELPERVTKLSDAFIGCTSLTTIDLPESVEFLDGTFKDCTSLTSIDLPESVEYLNGTFKGCTSLTSIDLPESVRKLNGTFKGCTSLTSIDLPESVSSLNGTFKDCTSLTTIDLPESVSYLDSTFCGCTSLTTIDLPKSVISLDSTFYGCTSLTSVNMLGDNALYLGNTFKDCPNLRAIRLFSPIPSIPREFPELSDNVTIYVPKGSYMSYRVTGWGAYNLMEFDAVGIDTPVRTNKAGVPEYYSIEGKLLTSPQRGVNIVREADGTTKKVFIQRP